MTKQDMLKKMEEKQYATSFKERLLNLWDKAEIEGVPELYFADVGSVVINGLHINNGIGDGMFRIGVAYSTDANFYDRKKLYEDTGIFFYSEYVSICLYDLLPESAFTCRFANMKFAEVLKDKDGNILIAVHC